MNLKGRDQKDQEDQKDRKDRKDQKDQKDQKDRSLGENCKPLPTTIPTAREGAGPVELKCSVIEKFLFGLNEEAEKLRQELGLLSEEIEKSDD